MSGYKAGRHVFLCFQKRSENKYDNILGAFFKTPLFKASVPPSTVKETERKS